MENRALRVVFPIFVGILIALLVGFGVQAFYPQPEVLPARTDYDSFRQGMQDYSRIVSVAISAIATVPLVLGALLAKRAAVIADGLLLGGVFTLVYAAMRGSGAEAGLGTAAGFSAVAVGFVLALAALYVRETGWTLRPAAVVSNPENATLAVVSPLAAAPLASFVVGLGVQAVYPPPSLGGYLGSGYPSGMALYGRNSALVATAAAVLLVVAGAALIRRASIAADALILGGLVTLVAATTRALGPEVAWVSFLVGAAAFLVAVGAGHVRLVGWRRHAAPRGPGAGTSAGTRMFAVVHPLVVGALAVAAFFVGVLAFYPVPQTAGVPTAWIRTVSVAATVVAVVLLVASLALGRVSSSAANALLVSGLFTLFAGVAPAAMANEQAVVFVALAVALVVVLIVGYRRFARRGRTPKRPPGAPPAVPPAPAA